MASCGRLSTGHRLTTCPTCYSVGFVFMPVQIFLEGKLLGIDEFLLSPAGEGSDHVFTGRSHWVSLLSEILPRALLAELGLARILLGSSGGGRFLLLLPEESRTQAEAFLTAASAEVGALSNGILKLI